MVDTLIKYPVSREIEQLRFLENKYLVDSFDDVENLKKVKYLRNKRHQLLEVDFVLYEKEIERYEGAAYYLENKYLEENSKLSLFSTPDEVYLKDFDKGSYRRHFLMKGALFYYLLSREEDALDCFASDALLCNLSPIEVDMKPSLEIDNKLEQKRNRNELKQSESLSYFALSFNEKPGVKCMDPMNMESVDENLIKHNGRLSLVKDDNFLTIQSDELYTLYRQEIWDVLEVRVKDINFKIKDNYLIIGDSIKWKVLKIESPKRIILV